MVEALCCQLFSLCSRLLSTILVRCGVAARSPRQYFANFHAHGQDLRQEYPLLCTAGPTTISKKNAYAAFFAADEAPSVSWSLILEDLPPPHAHAPRPPLLALQPRAGSQSICVPTSLTAHSPDFWQLVDLPSSHLYAKSTTGPLTIHTMRNSSPTS